MRIGVVTITRDRRAAVLRALARVPAGLPVCLVDNGSRDGTPEAVRERFPAVDVVALDHNLGGAARTVGVRRLGTEVVAFADDDSWWAPDALQRAPAVFERHPRLGLVAGRVLVGPQQRLDPVCAAMRDSPLARRPGLPGPPILGFVACGAVVRADAYLSVGGFDARYGIGGEERPLAVGLAAAGWDLVYLDDLVAHHHPDRGPRPGRSWRQVRNDVWSAWLHRPLPAAMAGTLRTLGRVRPPVAARATVEAARGLPWVLRERRVVPPGVEADLRRLEE